MIITRLHNMTFAKGYVDQATQSLARYVPGEPDSARNAELLQQARTSLGFDTNTGTSDALSHMKTAMHAADTRGDTATATTLDRLMTRVDGASASLIPDVRDLPGSSAAFPGWVSHPPSDATVAAARAEVDSVAAQLKLLPDVADGARYLTTTGRTLIGAGALAGATALGAWWLQNS